MNQLSNGLSLVLLPSPLAPVVAIQAWVSVGSADETPKQAGLSHFMEHMLFKGTVRRGVGDVARDIESAGGEINAWTSRDNTVFHVVMPSRYADIGVDVLADALQNSVFDAGEMEREREVILEEIRQGRDEPMRVLAQNMFQGAFAQHPYRHPVIGSEKSVAQFRRADLQRFHERWYRASDISLVVAGDFDPKAMRSTLSKKFSGLPVGSVRKRRRAREKNRASGTATVASADVSLSQLALAFLGPLVGEADCAALDLLTVAMGQGESSPLSSELVRETELCRSAYGYVHALRDHSLVVIGAASDPEKLSKALPRIGHFLERLRGDLVSAADLAKAKQAVYADSVYGKQTVEGAAQVAGSYLSLTGDADFQVRYLAQVAALTAEELRAAAQRFLKPSAMHLTALLPASAKVSSKSIQGRAASRMMALVHKGAAKTKKSASLKPRSATSRTATSRTASSRTASSRSAISAAVRRHQLDNGMTVIIKRDTSVPLVAARAVWSGGSLRETHANSGISSLMANVITRGCGRWSAEEVMEEVDATASSLSGVSGRNSFGMQAEWMAADWLRGLDLMSDCLLSPSFSEEEIERSKRAQLASIKAQEVSPSHQVFRLFESALFRKHPYMRNSLGTEASVGSIKASQVRALYQKHYPISGMTLAVVGDVDPAKVLARIESRFASASARLRPSSASVSEDFSSPSSGGREVYRYMERAQAHLIIGYPGLRMADADGPALEVLTTILGGQGGRLFLELRDRQSLAYQVGAYSVAGLVPGYVAVYLSCAPEKVEVAVQAVHKEIKALLASGVDDDELQRAKRYLVGSHDIAEQRRSSVAAALAFHSAYGLDYKRHLEYDRRISAVKRSDVARVARRLFVGERSVTATVTPLALTPKAAKRIGGVVKKSRKHGRKK